MSQKVGSNILGIWEKGVSQNTVKGRVFLAQDTTVQRHCYMKDCRTTERGMEKV